MGGRDGGFSSASSTETLAVPTNDRIRLNDMQHMSPVRPHLRRKNPEQAIGASESGPRMHSFEHSELLSEHQIL